MQSSKRTNLEDRYRLGEVLGRGGMGVVYKAFDTMMKRDVALKTILDTENLSTLELFYKECGTLAGMVHPNVISIYDLGEFEQEGVTKPFFVMPLLPGVTLDQLIKDNSPRLTVEGVADIIGQAARGLHAAHEMGLVHRDVKPSNLFILNDGSVKIIDFGIARQISSATQTSLKGTLPYMPPEQIQMKPPTAQGDQYALAVVCYEALARRRPFRGASEADLVEAIVHSIPPPISDINSNVKYVMSQVVHKALAKQPWHRFYTVKEFGEALLKGSRGESLDYFDNAKIRPRLERATASFNSGDYEFASEVLAELEGEGYLDHSIALLRRRVDQASRQRRVKQLLESATRYFEANEYPLALRKIQESLELDAENTDALSLKSRVERERREKKIDEWIQLARQHLDNQAFLPAREALDNVLKIKPNDTAALSLMADVDRSEREFSQTRVKKSSLYEAAVQAWERGEVTSALSKLDVLMLIERESPDSDSERSHTYQAFYNQVRSEHDELKNSYEQARRELSAENFASAIEICRRCLQKYPNHALFQALDFDVEQRKRQKLSAFIAETDRRADEEPDLDRRFTILEEAAKTYPDEKHFQGALKPVREKRDLVNSIVNKARYFEERGQYNEALDQWQIIRSIHAPYPGIGFEIERLQNRRDQQAGQAARTRAIEEIERHMDSGGYDRALIALRIASAEFPGDKELPELEKLVLKNKENAAQAANLLGQAKELAEAEKLEDSLKLLREARQLDPPNPVIRAVLVNSLLALAVQKKEMSDWDAAEPLIRELLEIKPNHPPALSLQTQVADRKREEFVSRCLAQARRLQLQDDYPGALALVDQGLAVDPKEPRLQQLRATLTHRQTGASATPAGAGVVLGSAAVVGGAESPARPQPSPSLADEHFQATTLFALPADTKKTAENGGTLPPVLPPVVPPAIPPLKPPAQGAGPQPPHQRRNWLLAVAGAGAVIILLVISFFIGRPPGKKGKPPITEISSTAANVQIHSNQPNAEISIDGQPCGTGQCQQSLEKGPHQIEARLTGYGATATGIDIKPGVPPKPVELSLSPQLPLVVVSTNLNPASLTLDTGQPINIQDGEVQIKDLTAGPHSIHFKGEQYSANFDLTATPAKLTEIQPLPHEQVWVAIGSVLGPQAKILSNMQGAQVAVDGNDSGQLGKPEIDLTDLAPGQHEVTFKTPTGAVQRLAFTSGPSPLVVAYVGIDKNGGTIQIDVGEDDATVFIDGKKMSRLTARGGHYSSATLPPGIHKVHVEKDGFHPMPDIPADVKAGLHATVSFQLVRIPTTASLLIRSNQAGAEVSVDGRKVGATGADGTVLANDIPPGRHAVTVRKNGFRQVNSDQNFTAGSITPVDASLQSAIGTLRVDVLPAGVSPHITIHREGEDAAKPLVENPIQLTEGTYAVSASAPGYQDAKENTNVVGGQSGSVTLTLKPAAAPRPVKARGFGMADWEKLGGWDKEGPNLTRKGGGPVFAPSAGEPGHYSFSIKVIKGKRAEWFTNFVDDRNNVLFQLDDDHLTITTVVDGAKKTIKPSFHINREDWVMISMDVSDSSISINVIQQDKKLSASVPAGHPTGKFAFRVPGKDEIEVSDFHFVPR